MRNVKIGVLFAALVATVTLLLIAIQRNSQTVSGGSALVVNIPQKALINNYLQVSAEAKPGTECELTFIAPKGEADEMKVTANANGFCVWKWKIEPKHGTGSGRLIFTINGKSETHFIEIRASF